MAETLRTCRRCGEAAREDWSYCPHCAMILSDSEPAPGTLSDRIRYVRRDAAERAGARNLTQPLANLSIAVAILLMLGGGVVLFSPSLVPSLFRPQELEIAPLEPSKAPEKDPPSENAIFQNRWVTIPAGDFQYGPTGNAEELSLDYDFQIQKYEVTNYDWYEYLRSERARLKGQGRFEEAIPRHWGMTDPTTELLNNELWDLPVVNINWYQAWDYCVNYLANQPGCEGARLPTNYEWEKAARGTTDDRPWPWGDEYFYMVQADEGGEQKWPRANTAEMPNGVPVRVNAYMRDKSPFDVIGMAGNVGEFVGDPSRNYLAWMGGAFSTDRVDAKVYVETPIAPGAEHCWSYVGFRAARTSARAQSGAEAAPEDGGAGPAEEREGKEEEER